MPTSSPRHVLVVDNDAEVRESVSFNLGAAGFKVLCAGSAAEARQTLAREIVHVVVIDMRLHDDKQTSDTSGFDLAHNLPDYIPFIIFTGYEDIENVRRALGEVKAKAILSKKKAGAAAELCHLVRQMFAQDVKVNFALQIDSTLAPAAIAKKIELPEADQATGLVATADDVTQILRTLFFDAEAISVTSLLPPEQAPSISQAGSLVALVRPKLVHGWGASKVAKFGARADIEQEAERYKTFKDYPHGQRLPRLDSTAYARQIGGLTYSLIDGTEHEQQLQVFGQFFEKHSAQDVTSVLDRFFRQTFGTLYRDAQHDFLDLPAAYATSLGLTPDKLRRAMVELRPDMPTAPRLHFEGLTESFTNPYLYAVQDGGLYSFTALVRKCLCHGDLHGRNILVDQEKHFWLIDFGRVEVSHALRDFAELESDIKFGLLPVTHLSALLDFEQKLLTPQRFNQKTPGVSFADKQLDKTYRVIVALRKLAFDLVRPEQDMHEYYHALFMHTLKALRLRHIEAKKKEHALMAAALLCERLDSWPTPPIWLRSPGKTMYPKSEMTARLKVQDLGEQTTSAKGRSGTRLRGASDQYDAFISYRHVDPDQKWVWDKLLPDLQEAEIKVCVDYDWFDRSMYVVENMRQAVMHSRYTLFVLSKAWGQSDFTDYEMNITVHEGLKQGKRRMLIVQCEECTIPDGLDIYPPFVMTDEDKYREELVRLVKHLKRAPRTRR